MVNKNSICFVNNIRVVAGFFMMLIFCLMLPCRGESHLAIVGKQHQIALARPYDQVVKDFRSRGFIQKNKVEEGTLLLGKFWNMEPVAAVPLREGDSCHMVMMIFPDPGTPAKLFCLYNKVRAQVTETYGIYGKEENVYIDENLNDFSSVEAKIAAAKFEQAILFTQFTLLDGTIEVSIGNHEATGLSVFAVFKDKDYREDETMPEGVTVVENQALEPTRFKGVDINRASAEVVRDLLAQGLRDEMSLLERRFYQKNHITKLVGEYFGQRDCQVTVQGEPDVDLVHVRFPASTQWQDLYALYSSLRESLAVKYGSIYRNDDQVEGVTQGLEQFDNARALQAIRQGRAHLETMLLNRYDGHAFKMQISYASHDNTYRVDLIYYTPRWLKAHMGKSNDL